MFRKFDLRATLTTGLALTLASSLAMSGCGAETPKPKAKTAVDNDQVIGAGGDTEAGLGGGGGKVNPEQILPKAKKREISADQHDAFEKAMARYMSAKKSGGLSGGECTSVADGFKSAAEGTPVLLEALLQRGRGPPRMRPRGRGDPDLAGHERGQDQVRPGHDQPRLHRLEEQRARPRRAAVHARDRGGSAAHRRGAQQPGPDPARQGAPRELVGREEAVRRPGGQPPAHRAGARQQQPAGVRDAGVHLLRDEHARDGEAGRQPGHQEGRRDRDRQVRGREGRGGRRGQGRQGQEREEEEGVGQGQPRTTASSRRRSTFARPAPASPRR